MKEESPCGAVPRTNETKLEDLQFHPHVSMLQVAWDNTSLSLYKTCPRLYYYTIVEGWKHPRAAPPLLWGGAWHKVLETYEGALAQGAEREPALRAAVREAFALSAEPWCEDDTSRTRLTLVRSLVWYAKQYENDPFRTYVLPSGRPATELSFRFPLQVSPDDSSDPYIYCGHIDRLTLFSGGVYVMERKHTTASISASFWNKYAYSAQVIGYSVAGNIVLPEPLSGVVIDAAQVQVNSSTFSRRALMRTAYQMEEWLEDTATWIKRVEQSARSNSWPHNQESCWRFGRECLFLSVCSAHAAARQSLLKANFIQQRWNPLENR